jgi:3-deoxy-D-manno-octulosonate 8-phosphate phosphatase (KDO 8-P phosphatase)
MKIFENIKFVSTDLDGTLTDGSISIDTNGIETRSYCVYDGQRIKEAKSRGIVFACITASADPGIETRMKKIGFDYCVMNVKNKGPILCQLLEENKISKKNALHIGDDINDIEAFNEVGVKVAVLGGAVKLLSLADYTTTRKGGRGTLREILDILLDK